MPNRNERNEAALGASTRPHTAAVLGLAVGAAYLLWRSTTLGSASLLTLPVFALELWAFGELALLAIQVWRVPPSPVQGRPRAAQQVDIAILAAGKSVAELERTLISSRAVKWRGRLVVIDDTTRIRHRQVAHNGGASYVADGHAQDSPAATAHRHTASDRYLWLEAGQLPMPDVLEMTEPRFERPETAVCQVATSLLNADALAHLHRDGDDDLMLNRVLGPALSRWDAAPWTGPAAVIRRSSIDEVGGVGPGITTERLTVRLHRSGHSTSFEPRRLVATTAPETIPSYLALRHRRARAAFDVALSREGLLAGAELGLRARLALLGATARHLSGIRQMLVAAAAVVVLLTGSFPVEASAWALVPFWLGSLISGAMARRALARGTMVYGDWVRQGWRALEGDVGGLWAAMTGRAAPSRTAGADSEAPTGLRALVDLPLLDAIALALDLALLARAATLVLPDLLPRFTMGQRIMALGLAMALLVPIVDVLQVVVLRRQQRGRSRIPAVLEATLDGIPATTFDITPEGIGILLPVAPGLGVYTTVEVSLPGADGVMRRIVGRALVRSTRPAGPDQWRVGLELARLALPAQQALTAFCANFDTAVGAPSTDGVDRGDQETETRAIAAHRQRPLRGITAAAGLAGVATLAFGPGAASASGVAAEDVQSICVTAADGSPTPAVAVERVRGDAVQRLGTTDSVGCLEVGAGPGTSGFTLDFGGRRYDLQAGDFRSPAVRIEMETRQVRVLDGDGETIDDVELRYHTGRWLSAPTTNEGDGTFRFETFAADVAVAVSRHGTRYVRSMGRDAELTVVLGRMRFDEGADPAVLEGTTIDRGRGWEPLTEGAIVIPGRLVIRLGDGEVMRIELPEAHDLVLPSGELRPLSLEIPTGSEQPAADPEPPSDEDPEDPEDPEPDQSEDQGEATTSTANTEAEAEPTTSTTGGEGVGP